MSSSPAAEKVFDGLPVFADGHLEMTDAPGLGFTLRDGALREFAAD
jgi:L-alanine-DL-glutamate epimerase-like enolase superfamily enzyme